MLESLDRLAIDRKTASETHYACLLSLGAIGALFSISGTNPWWSLAVFFLCIYIIHGVFIYGDEPAEVTT